MIRRRMLIGGKKLLYIFCFGDKSYGLPVAKKSDKVKFTSKGTLNLWRHNTDTPVGYINFGPVDLTKYKKLVVELDGHGYRNFVGVSQKIMVGPTMVTSDVDAYVASSESSAGVIERKEINIQSNWTDRYVYIGISSRNAEADIYNLWLE